jgi:hypothetical protein
MTISHFDWHFVGYLVLLAIVLVEARTARRRWASGVLEYPDHRVERAVDAKRFRYWFIADIVAFTLGILVLADWIAQK